MLAQYIDTIQMKM